MRALFFVLVACATPAATLPKPASPLEVTTDRGVVVGRATGGVREFLGIPFAAPPIAALRWQPPAPVAAWSVPRDATKRGFACTQPEEGFHRDTSEDCLNLNVWVPDGATATLPVLFWIHGGAFYQGSGGDDLYDGALLAKRARVIVVTSNYRLGPLGFASHRALAAEHEREALPAYGLLDQRAAMQWVQRNITAFGGDPTQVTLFGESAGAWSQCAHLVMQGSRGLFSRAIVQSGACSDALYFTRETANAQGDELAAAVGCTGADVARCLRGKTADELASALTFKRGLLLPPGVWWGPIVDGVELRQMPLAAIRAGEFARVPLIIGTTRDEGTLHTMRYDAVTADELAGFVRGVFGDAAVAPAIARYARATPKIALTDIVTEGIFACNSRRVARLVAARGVPVYLYQWTHALDGPPKVHALGPTHGVDLFFVFGTTSLEVGPSTAELPLVELVQGAWGDFARTGDPGHRWPRYTADHDEHLILDLPSTIGAHLHQATCDFWDSLSLH
ncbi:MAG: carboxylesterase family protein [Kofleriaceae bacterium]